MICCVRRPYASIRSADNVLRRVKRIGSGPSRDAMSPGRNLKKVPAGALIATFTDATSKLRDGSVGWAVAHPASRKIKNFMGVLVWSIRQFFRRDRELMAIDHDVGDSANAFYERTTQLVIPSCETALAETTNVLPKTTVLSSSPGQKSRFGVGLRPRGRTAVCTVLGGT